MSETLQLSHVEAVISSVAVQAHVEYLASDALRGRDTPSPGLELASVYVSDAFRSFGLRPMGDGGGFVQRWPFTKRAIDRDGIVFAVHGPIETPELLYGRDYFVVPARGSADAEGGSVYVGRIDVVGDAWPRTDERIAVVASGPQFGPKEMMMLRRGAAASQAAGVLLLLDPALDPGLVARAATQLDDGSLVSPVPVAAVERARIENLLNAAGLTLEAIESTSPVPLANTRIRIRAPLMEVEHSVPNVVAVLPGSDPQLQDEYVVISAHLDHIGVGTPVQGDSIFNGADDNASGVSAVIEVASALTTLSVAPPRSIIFLAVSGEEHGLLGAEYFTEHSPVSMTRVIANINLDMVGRNDPGALIGVGQEYNSLGPLAHRISREHPALNLAILEDANPRARAFFRSDQVAFVRQGVPSLFLTSWLHSDYQKPSDEAQRVDADKVARVARLVLRLAHAIATDSARPTWVGLSLEELQQQLRGSTPRQP